MPALPVLMVQFDNDAVDIRYSDGSRLQLSPCGASFHHWDPPDTQLHPLHGVRHIQQRCQFSLSRFRTKVLEALDFRNRFAHQPYLCQELLSPEAVVYLHSNITHIAWANTLQDSDINIQPDGTIQLTSEDEYTTMVLSQHGRDFTVCYLSKISPFPSKKPKAFIRKNPTSSPKTFCDDDSHVSVVKNVSDVAECTTDANNSNSRCVSNISGEIDNIDSTPEACSYIIPKHSQCDNSNNELGVQNSKQHIINSGELISGLHLVKDNDSIGNPVRLNKDVSALGPKTLAHVIPAKCSLISSESQTDYVPSPIDHVDSDDNLSMCKSKDNSTVVCQEEHTCSFQISSSSAFLPISARLGPYLCRNEDMIDSDDLDASEVASNTSYAELKIARNTPPCSASKHVSFSVPLKKTTQSSCENISHLSSVPDSASSLKFVDNLAADSQPRDLLCPIPLHGSKNNDQNHDRVRVNAEQFERNTDLSVISDISRNKQIIPHNYDETNMSGVPVLTQNHQEKSLHKTSPLTQSQTTNKNLELSPIGCISSNRKPGYITEDALQSERESHSGHYYTWVTRHVSCSDCPSEWYHPSCLLQQAFDHYHNEQEDFREEIKEKRQEKESKLGKINNLPLRIDTEKCVMCTVADPVPLSCPGQHLHRWHSSGAGDETGSPPGRINVVMSEGVIYRLIRVSSLKLVEVYPGDGSVIFSQGMTGHYFSHLIAQDTELEEKSYSLNHLPPDYPGCVYSIDKLVRKAASLPGLNFDKNTRIHSREDSPGLPFTRLYMDSPDDTNLYFDQMLQEDTHLMHAQDKCCWKYVAKAVTSEPAPMKMTEECTVAGVGRFTAYSNGRVRVVFSDRTALDMNMNVQSRRRNGGTLDDIPTAHCRLLLPNAQYVLVDMQKPAPYECYVDPTVQWIGWVSATTDQRNEIYSKHMQNIDQKMSVARELQKINCFNYIVDKTVFSHNSDPVTGKTLQRCTRGKNSASEEAQKHNTQGQHARNKSAKHVQFEKPRFTDADNKVSLQNISDFDDVRLALQRTSNIIKDIDSILTLKK